MKLWREVRLLWGGWWKEPFTYWGLIQGPDGGYWRDHHWTYRVWESPIAPLYHPRFCRFMRRTFG